MSPEQQLALETAAQRYGARCRIAEALSACGEPQELARVLGEQLRELISFDHLDLLIFEENSHEIEWHGWGTEPIAFPDIPVEETSSWHVYQTQEPLHIADWNTDDTFPRLKQLLENGGPKIGSVIRVPLTTAHRRLGALGIASRDGQRPSSPDLAGRWSCFRNFRSAMTRPIRLTASGYFPEAIPLVWRHCARFTWTYPTSASEENPCAELASFIPEFWIRSHFFPMLPILIPAIIEITKENVVLETD